MKTVEFYTKVDASVALAKIIFNYLMKKYPKKTIADIAETTSGGTPSRSMGQYYMGNIPWIKSGELNDGLISEYSEAITEEALKNSSAKLYSKGTLVLALYGATVGKVGIVNFETTSNQAVCAIFPSEEVNKKYLFWFLRQKRLDFIRASFGGAQPNISQAVVKKTMLPVPPLSVQNQVVEILDEYEKSKNLIETEVVREIKEKLHKYNIVKTGHDKILKNNSTNLGLCEKLRQAILQEAVSGKLVSQNPEDEPASELIRRIKFEKEEQIKGKRLKKGKNLPPISIEETPYEIPKGWSWIRLGEISTKIGSGSTPLGGRNVYEKTGIAFIRSQNVWNTGLELDDVVYITNEINKKMEGTRVLPGDILLNITGASIGRTCIVPEKFEEGNVSQHVSIIRLVSSSITSFVHSFLLSSYLQDRIMDVQVGVSREGLSKKNMELFLIPIPPLSEQNRIIQKLGQLLKLCLVLEEKIREDQSNSEYLMEAVLKEAFAS